MTPAAGCVGGRADRPADSGRLAGMRVIARKECPSAQAAVHRYKWSPLHRRRGQLADLELRHRGPRQA